MRIAGTQPVRQRRQPIRDDAYRKHVASRHCRACGAVGRSQAAHITKGNYTRGKQPDDNLCIPLCATWPDRPGCHDIFDGRAYVPGSPADNLKRQTEQLKIEARENFKRWQQENSPDDGKHMD